MIPRSFKAVCFSLALLATVAGAVAIPAARVQAQVVDLDNYDGWVVLENPQGYPVPFHWYIVFHDNGFFEMTSAGVYLTGWWGSHGGHRYVQLNNAPYYSYFVGHKEGAKFVVDHFGDTAGNTIAYSNLQVFED